MRTLTAFRKALRDYRQAQSQLEAADRAGELETDGALAAHCSRVGDAETRAVNEIRRVGRRAPSGWTVAYLDGELFAVSPDTDEFSVPQLVELGPWDLRPVSGARKAKPSLKVA